MPSSSTTLVWKLGIGRTSSHAMMIRIEESPDGSLLNLLLLCLWTTKHSLVTLDPTVRLKLLHDVSSVLSTSAVCWWSAGGALLGLVIRVWG
jgi:hypothetical protein